MLFFQNFAAGWCFCLPKRANNIPWSLKPGLPQSRRKLLSGTLQAV
jgi:hypothetical protein